MKHTAYLMGMSGMEQMTMIQSVTAVETSDEYGGFSIVLPLEACEGGGSCVRFVMEGDTFLFAGRNMKSNAYIRAIVDTGSPYLIVPEAKIKDSVDIALNECSECAPSNKSKRYIFRNSNPQFSSRSRVDDFDADPISFFLKSAYPPTFDIYGSKEGKIDWRTAPVSFRSGDIHSVDSSGYVFGITDEVLSEESGGALLGLVKQSNKSTTKVDIRPTWLEQVRLYRGDVGNENALEVKSFRIDTPRRQLTISSKSLIPESSANALALIDLRPLGDFVDHYACVINELYVDGRGIRESGWVSKKRDIVAVFDTGLTGCLFTEELWTDVSKGLGIASIASLQSVRVDLETKGFKSANFSVESSREKASGLFVTRSISLDWFDEATTAPHVVVLGQAFLAFGALTIDIDKRKALFENM
eukprot:CAMPEP_0196812824 /NCGR_PEP_ID=MMETSP1362-20130617/31669_1 /TAXON_ID=163516 /ORGANISM="Leptocylindrus danicus, Strain CCMP1856" /LENGTH=414 /DNA_ID=CAMNT_0042188747 /DNA_START=102 /DNA_END=1346 /DNA_ORIENTATION=+